MLPNDFQEEYFRLENTLITNVETIFVDRSGRVILTTPFFISDDELNINFRFFAGQNIHPQNVNLIIDQIALFSSNPNCQNYLPLKIELANNQQVEFGNTETIEMTDYEIIVDPPVNLETVKNHRYENLNVISYQHTDQIEIVIKSVEFNDKLFVWFNDTDDQLLQIDLITEVGTLVTLDGSVIIDLLANEHQALAITTDGSNIYWENLDNNSSFDVTGYNSQINAVNLREVFIERDVTIFLFFDNGGPGTTFEYFNKNFESIFIFPVPPFDVPVISANFYNFSLIIGYDLNYMKGIKTLTTGGDEFVTIFENTDFPNLSGSNFITLFLGGTNLDSPNISIFSHTGGVLFIDFVDDFESVKNGNLNRFTKTIQFGFDPRVKLFKYRNQVPIISNGMVNFYNVDDGSVKTYSLDQIKPNNPPFINTDSVSYNGSHSFYLGKASVPELKTILVYNFPNSRSNNKVYKLVYNYDERNFPYNLASQAFRFRIRLPNNNPISDLELFKYIIDLRIRYSKQRDNPNPVAKGKKGDKLKKKRIDLSEIYLVDED